MKGSKVNKSVNCQRCQRCHHRQCRSAVQCSARPVNINDDDDDDDDDDDGTGRIRKAPKKYEDPLQKSI